MELGGDVVAVSGCHGPSTGCFVVNSALDPRLEADVAPQIESIGDVLGVTKNLGLSGVLLAPFPLLLEVGIEGVGVVDTAYVAPSPWIAIPVPGAPDVGRCFEYDGVETLAAEQVQQVHPCETSSDNNNVHFFLRIAHCKPPAQTRRESRSGAITALPVSASTSISTCTVRLRGEAFPFY